MSSSTLTPKGYTFCYYVSGHGFGHATRVNQIITELLKSTTTSSSSSSSSSSTATAASLAPPTAITTKNTEGSSTNNTPTSTSRHTIYIVSDAPEFIFQDVTALGAKYRNAKVDAGVVQPLAYSVDRQKTIEGVKSFLARREEILQTEVSWLAQVGADCVLADAPFLPCAAASAYGIPACLITNFTFDEVYRFLREGDTLDKDVMAVADAALEDYKKASLLLRLPGSIDIPSFEDEILAMETSRSNGSPSVSDMDDIEEDHRILSLSTIQEQEHDFQQQQQRQQLQTHSKAKEDGNGAALLPMDVDEHYRRNSVIRHHSNDTIMGDITPSGIMSPATSIGTTVSSPSPSILGCFRASSIAAGSDSSLSMAAASPMASKVRSLTRKVIDVPLVVRMAVNTREDVLRSLGVDELTIATKKMVLVSFGGQRLKQGWGNPLPEGWIGVICGLPVEHELPEGFYRSPHGVYVPDLTRAADIVIGKLGYGTCSECIAHDTPLIYVSRPQFVEEHGLIKMMINHGLPVEMTAEEFENGQWQRSILEADRQAQEEKEGRRLHMESCSEDSHDEEEQQQHKDEELTTHADVISLAESVNRGELAKAEPISLGRRTRRSSSVTSLSAFRVKGPKMARLSPVGNDDDQSSTEEKDREEVPLPPIEAELEKTYVPAVWFERRIPHNGGEVCARLVEEFMARLEEDDE
ncbi:hypothetical protein BG015_003588 [Linnemannia schmuckeri]|uniref:L-arabinokinase n=1 Tax=Linnemannia schmuckeri TaxID=64567 RepID=A0A9P5S7J7_9FUNG|nr:hypothetical protein BG015_003588 [Linnemannia schmuckeri]